MNLGFIGLGAMGLPMASNLISKVPQGSNLFIYEISEDLMEKLTNKHGDCVTTCSSAREVARSAVSGCYKKRFMLTEFSYISTARRVYHAAGGVPC